jgi:hypothetical protein
MKATLLLIVSLAVNVVLAGGVMFLSREFTRLPNSTPAAVIYNTNAHAAVEKAPDATLP